MIFFSKKVGRPTNASIKKKEILKYVSIILPICLIIVAVCFFTRNNYSGVNSKNKNASLGGNIFSTVNRTASGVSVSYNKNTQILTLNGTATGSFELQRLTGRYFNKDEKYQISLSFVSGSYVNTGTSCFATEIKQSGGGALQVRNNADTKFPSKGTSMSILTTNTSAAQTGNQILVWLWKSGTLRFNNYKVKVSIIKIANGTPISSGYGANSKNIFSTINKTTSGVSVNYNKNTQILTLNGTATGSFELQRLTGRKFNKSEQYKITLTYVSGSYVNTGTSCFATEIKQSGGVALQTRNNADTKFPSKGTSMSILTTNTSAAQTGNQILVWLWKSGTLRFNNYKVKVNIEKTANGTPVPQSSSLSVNSSGYKVLNYNIGNLSKMIGSQTKGDCHAYSIAYGAFILLNSQNTNGTKLPKNASGGRVKNESVNYGACYFTHSRDRNCDSTVPNISSYSQEYSAIVNKINNKIPVAIHVRSQYSSTHWVLVVGYKNGVNNISNSSSELLKNVWIIDPYSASGYGNKRILLYQGTAYSRSTSQWMKDYEIRTWNSVSSAF